MCTLEGTREKPNYKDVIAKPVLRYSGVFEHSDLYVTCQIYANNQELCMPIKTSYKFIEKQYCWDEWLTLPLRISDLPKNSLLTITAWDLYTSDQDIPVAGSTIPLFDKYGELRQGSYEVRMWPNKAADGNENTKTPGLISDMIENDIVNTSETTMNVAFPILDELDRLAKMSKLYQDGHIIHQEWLDRVALKELEYVMQNERRSLKEFTLKIEFPEIKSDDIKYHVIYFEENADKILHLKPTQEMFVVNDPEIDLDNIIELKHRKLEHSRQMNFDMGLKPDTETKQILTKILNYPMTRALKREEQTLLWKYRYYLTQNKKALTKILQCFNLNFEFEGNKCMELLAKWQPMDVEDALELLGSKYKDYPKIRSYAVSRLQLASDNDLTLYLLQLVQALRYENFAKGKSLSKKDPAISSTIDNSDTNRDPKPTPIQTISASENNLSKTSSDNDNAKESNENPNTIQQNIFDLNLKTFLINRAKTNEIVADCLYWYVKVEMGDKADDNKNNFHLFLDELIAELQNDNACSKHSYENILKQEIFLKNLNEVVRTVQREGGLRDKKVIKLRQLLSDQAKHLMNFDEIPLILDPQIKINGIIAEQTTMFKSNLMPCKFTFRTVNDVEYAAIYKIGDDLRQDQLVLQMIALMDKLLKQENLDLKLTPYKVIATGTKEGFLQYIDALPVSQILNTNSEYKSMKEYLRKNNPSDTDRHGIASEVMDAYVRSSAGYMIITYILGVGDRHYDNILLTKTGRLFHVDFGYILGRDPKPFQPVIKWTKDMADGMGGKIGPDNKENKEYEDFKKYCCNAFLHLRRHASLIINLFSLMVDANIPDIALEPDKTVIKIMDRFKLDMNDEQALISLLKEIEKSYDSIVGNITDMLHGYSTAQK